MCKAHNACEKARESANYKKSKFDDNMFCKNYYQNFRNLLNCQKQLGLPYIPILYKNDGFGFRLENMKLSVFAKKINDGFKTNKLKPRFSKDGIRELEKFENQFVFEGEKQEMQQDINNEYVRVKLQNKDNNTIYDESEYKNITINNDVSVNNILEINVFNAKQGNKKCKKKEETSCCFRI